jgi:hypothetical protein
MSEHNKGILGFILVIIAMIIALFNPIIGIVCLALIYIFAIAESKKYI